MYADGGLLATYTAQGSASPALYFNFNDWLGTKRLEIVGNGTTAGQMVSWWSSDPFGNCLATYGTGTDATEQHFTGKERDTESGNDYFGARYYASSMGRFLSPDWSAKVAPVPYAKLDDPQTLNLYAYLMNNPLAGVDADGHVAPGGTGGCTGPKCTNGKSDGSVGKQIQQTMKDHPIATAVVTATAQTGLAVVTGGGSVAAEVAVDVIVEAAAETAIETESVEVSATIAEESAAGIESPEITAEELTGKTRSEIQDLADEKGLVPKGDTAHPDYPRKWSDPVTNKERLRLDRGHIDQTTGRP